MNAATILSALEQVDERFIASYTPAERQSNSKRSPLFRWLAVAACFALILWGVSILPTINVGSNSVDPHWAETHIRFTNLEEAINTFGDDLLLDRMTLNKTAQLIYCEYLLEHNGTDAANRTTWDSLWCLHQYDTVDPDRGLNDEISVNIIFSQETDNRWHSEFLTEADYERTTMTIGDTEVECFRAKSNGHSMEHIRVRFSHGDAAYYVSGTNDEMIISTATQMLLE